MIETLEPRHFRWRSAIQHRSWLIDRHWYVLLGSLVPRHESPMAKVAREGAIEIRELAFHFERMKCARRDWRSWVSRC